MTTRLAAGTSGVGAAYPWKGDRMSAGETSTRREASKGYGAHYLAQKFGITPDQAREVIRQVGPDRKKLNEAAGKVKRPMPRSRIRLAF